MTGEFPADYTILCPSVESLSISSLVSLAIAGNEISKSHPNCPLCILSVLKDVSGQPNFLAHSGVKKAKPFHPYGYVKIIQVNSLNV